MKKDSNILVQNITIRGDVPSKKNSKIMICRGVRPILISNPRFQSWNTEQLWLLKRLGSLQTKEIVKVDITYYPSTKRRSDLTNKAESIMDLLVEANIIEDDNWFVIPQLLLKLGSVDKEKPRTEVSIYYNEKSH